MSTLSRTTFIFRYFCDLEKTEAIPLSRKSIGILKKETIKAQKKNKSHVTAATVSWFVDNVIVLFNCTDFQLISLAIFIVSIITIIAYDNVTRFSGLFVSFCEWSYVLILSIIGFDALVVFDFLAILSLAGWFLIIGHNQIGRLTKEDWQRFWTSKKVARTVLKIRPQLDHSYPAIH